MINLERVNAENLYETYGQNGLNAISTLADAVKRITIKGRKFTTAIRSEILTQRVFGSGINPKTMSVNFNNTTNFDELPNNIKALIVAYSTFEETKDNTFGERLAKEKITMEQLDELFTLINVLKNFKDKNSKTYISLYEITNRRINRYIAKMQKYYGNVVPEVLLTKMNIERSMPLTMDLHKTRVNDIPEKEEKKYSFLETKAIMMNDEKEERKDKDFPVANANKAFDKNAVREIVSKKIENLKNIDSILQIRLDARNEKDIRITYVIASNNPIIVPEIIENVEELKLIFPNLRFEILSEDFDKEYEEEAIKSYGRLKK